MKKYVSNGKILGLLFLIAVMFYIVLNKNFKINHPIISYLYFYGSIPLYLFLLVRTKIKKTPVKIKPIKQINSEQDNNNYFNNMPVNYIDRLEKKTKKTLTTETTEIIYLINKEENYND